MGFPSFKGFADRLYRREQTTAPADARREVLAHYYLYAAMLGATLLFFGDLISGEAMRWSNAYPSVTLGKDDWKLLVNAPAGDCALSGLVSANCPAHPGNALLWEKGESRFDAKGSRKRKAKRDFWIGAIFTPEMVARARSLHANQLILGWVYSDFEVWVNGQWMATGLIQERQPMVLQLPLSSLEGNGPLKVAVLIHPDSEGGAPDFFAYPWKEGLATVQEASAFRSAAAFWKTAKPFGLFLLNLLFSVLFFFFWQVQKQKQEYFYFSVYGAMGALVQIKFMDIFSGSMDINGTHALELFLYTAEGGFGLMTALSFARSRREFFNWGIPLFMVVPWLLFFLPMDTGSRATLLKNLKFWMVPSLHFVGAMVCLVQARHLAASPRAASLGPRINRLYFFSFGMALICLIGISEGQNLISLMTQAFTSRFTHFSVVLMLAITAMREYREERKLLDKSPISKYHRKNPLPGPLKGALLCIDIKNSERLFRLSAETGDAGRIVEGCLSHLWSAVLAHQGTVLSTEGDGLRAFFDGDECTSPARSALLAVDQMQARLDEYALQLRDQGFSLDSFLSFRAGLVLGEIKPIWQQAGQSQVAGWTEAGQSNAFVDSARLMEAERQLDYGGSLLVSTVETAFALRGAGTSAGKWLIESRRVEGKHGNSYLVSAYSTLQPNATAPTLKLAA